MDDAETRAQQYALTIATLRKQVKLLRAALGGAKQELIDHGAEVTGNAVREIEIALRESA
jgi:hypothetical protein